MSKSTEAVRFDGGHANAVEVIKWLHTNHNVFAGYRAECRHGKKVVDPEYVAIYPEKFVEPVKLHAGEWVEVDEDKQVSIYSDDRMDSCDYATHFFHDTVECADHIVESLKRFGIEASHLGSDNLNGREIQIKDDRASDGYFFMRPGTEIRVVESPDGKSWRTVFEKGMFTSNYLGHYLGRDETSSDLLEETAQVTLPSIHTWDGTNGGFLLISEWLMGLGPYKVMPNHAEKRIEISARTTRGRDWVTYVHPNEGFWLDEHGVVKTQTVKTMKEDPVNHPSHYTDGQFEVADFIADKNLNFFIGNVVKYVCRAGKKDPTKHVEDLEKAQWYLGREIERQQGAKDDVQERVEKLYSDALGKVRKLPEGGAEWRSA